MPSDYLPGCYRHLPRHPDESLAGYLLRLATANRYEGIRALVQACNRPIARTVADLLTQLRIDGALVADLGRMAAGDAQYLSGYLCEPLPPLARPSGRQRPNTVPLTAVMIDDCRVDLDALLNDACAVCPLCLRDHGYAKADWDLAPVTACIEHSSLLVDTCSSCGQRLRWSRPTLTACGECGVDLRRTAVRKLSNSGVLETVADFAALAPFRLLTGIGKKQVAFWGEMFDVFKLLLLPRSQLALGEWPKSLARTSPLTARHEAIECIAATKAGNGYDLRGIQSRVADPLKPLAAVPLDQVIHRTISDFLINEVGLHGELAATISNYQRLPYSPAYAHIRPWPPRLRTVHDVSTLLGTDIATVDGLIRQGLLTARTKEQQSFDADEILLCGQFIEELMDAMRISQIAGLSVDPTDITAGPLLSRWCRTSRDDYRVSAESIVALQCKRPVNPS